jgi:hypothetical protein
MSNPIQLIEEYKAAYKAANGKEVDSISFKAPDWFYINSDQHPVRRRIVIHAIECLNRRAAQKAS